MFRLRGISLDKKTTVVTTFILFLLGAWLIGNMMNFQYDIGGSPLNLSYLEVIGIIAPFFIAAVVFYKGRSRMLLLLLSFALFWVITPIFFEALGALYFGLIILGSGLLLFAVLQGHISSKKVAILVSLFIGIGGLIVYAFSDVLADALYGYFPLDRLPSLNGESVSYLWDEAGVATESIGGPGVAVFILIFVLAIVFFMYQRFQPLKPSKQVEDEDKLEDDITSAVDRAITELHQGRDVKSTIIRCYQQMCLILEEKGVENEDSMTPREFEELATEKLDVPSLKIVNIREGFELAKYSSHPLGEKEKNRTLKNLKELKKDLE